MRPVDAFVAEIVADLVDALEPTDDEPLEVQLVGNAQIQWHVERVVMRQERPGRGAAVLRLEDGGLHLQVAQSVQVATHGRDHPRPGHESPPHLRMHSQVGIPLPVSLFGIGETRMPDESPRMALFLPEWEGPERLGEQRHRFHAHRDLTGARPEERPRDPDHVSQVEQVDEPEHLFAKVVAAEVQLDPRPLVREVPEHRLPVRTPGDQSARQANRLALLSAVREQPQRRRYVVGRVEAVRERCDACGVEGGEFLAPRLHDKVEVFESWLVAHAASAPPAPKRFRYASMNSSMSPSMTRCTSGIFNSVRWSFTMVYG